MPRAPTACAGRFAGNLQRVEFTLQGDWPRRIAAYETGQLDPLDFYAAPAAERDALRLRHTAEYLSGTLLVTYLLRPDLTRSPFDDVRVRRAFALGTDRERLTQVARRGYVLPANGGFVPSGMPGYVPGIGLPFDQAQARELLDQAGYPGGRGFPTLEARAATDQTTRMQFYAQAERILVDEAPLIPLAYSRSHLLLKPWVKQFPTSSIRLWFLKDVALEE